MHVGMGKTDCYIFPGDYFHSESIDFEPKSNYKLPNG